VGFLSSFFDLVPRNAMKLSKLGSFESSRFVSNFYCLFSKVLGIPQYLPGFLISNNIYTVLAHNFSIFFEEELVLVKEKKSHT
jgi:hypothetical protein